MRIIIQVRREAPVTTLRQMRARRDDDDRGNVFCSIVSVTKAATLLAPSAPPPAGSSFTLTSRVKRRGHLPSTSLLMGPAFSDLSGKGRAVRVLGVGLERGWTDQEEQGMGEAAPPPCSS